MSRIVGRSFSLRDCEYRGMSGILLEEAFPDFLLSVEGEQLWFDYDEIAWGHEASR